MFYLEPAIEAELHREMYIDILNGLLHEPGAKQKVAQRSGITPNYLSNILNSARVPSPKVGERIVESIAASKETKENLFNHILLASERRIWVRNAIKLEVLERPLGDIVKDLKRVEASATLAPNPQQAKQNYEVAKNLSISVLQQIDFRDHPLEFVSICIIAHDALCVLSQPDVALWYAKIANHVIAGIDDSAGYSEEKQRVEELAINCVRAEAVALHNLSLDREALRRCEQAEAMPAIKNNGKEWKPHIYRDKINIISSLPRFSIAEVESLAENARTICEQRSSEVDALLLFLISESLARAYIKHNNYKEAQQVIQVEADRQKTISNLGPLHKVLFLSTRARFCSAVQDQSGKGFFLEEAIQLSIDSGLRDQTAKLTKALVQDHFN